MKIITICGSYKFKKEIIEIAEIMTLKENCVLTPNELSRERKESYTKEKANIIDKMYKEKIKLSDTILVVNVNNYIGSSTKKEIKFATKLNKEIIYYADIINKR